MIKILQSKAARILGIIGLAMLAALIVLLLSLEYVRQEVPVQLFGKQVFVDSWKDGYVLLSGTWEIEGDRQAYPLQMSEITCRADWKSCVESQAEVSDTSTLRVYQDTKKILRWDEHILIYGTDSAMCVDYVYTVNRDTKQVSGIRKIKAGTENDCSYVTKELKLRLTDGADVYRKLSEEAWPKTANIAALMCILFWTGFRIRQIIKSQPPVS